MFETDQEKKIQIRSIIRFLCLKKYSMHDILQEIHDIYGNSVKRTMIYKWGKKFSEGERNVMESKRTGRKRKFDEVEKDKVEEILKNNRRITTYGISLQIDVSCTTVKRILKELGIFFFFQ